MVLDTNVLISACLKPGGLEAAMVAMALDGRVAACITGEIEAEYRDVLLRPKFQAVRERAEEIIAGFASKAIRVHARERISAALDEDDNRFLECAEASRAEYLITGNLRHYPAECAGTKVINARAFFESVVSSI